MLFFLGNSMVSAILPLQQSGELAIAEVKGCRHLFVRSREHCGGYDSGQGIWLARLPGELLNTDPATLCIGNNPPSRSAKIRVLHDRRKHIDLPYHFIRYSGEGLGYRGVHRNRRAEGRHSDEISRASSFP